MFRHADIGVGGTVYIVLLGLHPDVVIRTRCSAAVHGADALPSDGIYVASHVSGLGNGQVY
jgi:hypothetical protein